jgi:hypothetical protein
MKDAGLREEVIGELLNPCPTRVVLLTASPERAQPEGLDVGAEDQQGPKVGRHCMVSIIAGNHLLQPDPVFGDRLVQALEGRGPSRANRPPAAGDGFQRSVDGRLPH